MSPASAIADATALGAVDPADSADSAESLARQLELATLAALSGGLSARRLQATRPRAYPPRGGNRLPVDKPVLLIPLQRPVVPADLLPTLPTLRKHFRIVATCDGGVLEHDSARAVDSVISLWRDPKGFKHSVREIVRLRPALELYPTKGGAAEVTSLANLRLSPAQVFSGASGDALVEELLRLAGMVATGASR
jgi:hypothetical protein